VTGAPGNLLLTVRSPWKDGGTYLITGGLGGLGLIFAREIAAQAKDASLILVGRTAQPQDGPALAALRALGARVAYHQVDVTVASQIRELLRHIRAQAGSHSPLQGILHSAGVHQDGRISQKTVAEFVRVLAPKVVGTVNLDLATADLDLDFFVLFSSIAVVMGNPGQADYATANAFMDAYAAWRNDLVASGQRHGRTLSINWPLWQEGRMRAHPDVERIATRRTGLVAMPSAVGIDALRQALAAGQDQVMVLHGEPHKLYATLAEARPAPDAAGVATPVGQRQEALPEAAASALQQRAHDYFRRQIAALLELPVQRIGVDTPLAQYGFDSILLTKMTSRLEETFGTLPKTLLFEHQNVRQLTAYFLHTYPDTLHSLLDPSAGEIAPPSPWQEEDGNTAQEVGHTPGETATPSPCQGEGRGEGRQPAE
jgi:NADP-dependent 3-hydroxy acid dehydrogenase YdfG